MADADRHGMVQLKAKGFWTVNNPADGSILHGDDRKEADVNARYPYVTPQAADYLIGEKLAEEYDGKLPDEGEDEPGLTVGERAGKMVEANADAENSVEQTTGLSTRDTTAFERPIEALAGASGAKAAVVDADDGNRAPPSDDDAPAGGRRSAGRSRSGAPAADGK